MNISKLKHISGKYLSAVEVNHFQSNQHELHGITAFKYILGNKRTQLSPFLYYVDKNLNITCSSCHMTWYDAREYHPTRSEYRLYYSNNDVFNRANIDDLMLLCETVEGKYIILIIAESSILYDTIREKLALNYLNNDFTIDIDEDKKFIKSLWGLCENNANISPYQSFITKGPLTT